MTQLESARKGIITAEMTRVAVRENVTPEFIRDGVARGAIVIPANVRHLAGSAGAEPNRECRTANGERKGGNGATGAHEHSQFATRYSPLPLGHPTATPDGAYWVNQTVQQRRAWLFDPSHCRGERAPKRLDPTGIGRSITTKINANQGASPVSSSTDEELAKLNFAVLYGADTVMDLSTGGKLDECRQRIIDNSVVPVGTVPIYSMILGRRIEDLDYDTILKVVEHQARQGVDYFTIHAGILKEHLPLIRGRITGLVSRGGSLLAKWMIHHNKQNPMYDLFDEISAIMRAYDVTYSLGDGVAEAARAGAAMLCYVTPKEHVGLPKADDVKAGCIAYKIAAHAGDVARGIRAARQWDDDLSKARAALNWPKHFELAFDGETARALHDEDLEVDTDFCAMCGHDWCSMRISKEILDFASGKHEGYVPLKQSARSPGLTPEQQALLAARSKAAGSTAGPGGTGVSPGKLACHSDLVADDEAAKRVQRQALLRSK